MKYQFPGYYTPTKEGFLDLWNNCIFIVDTNVLLNLYRYTDKTRDELINIFNKITERLWIPNQVALEYHSDRIRVIIDQKNAYIKIRDTLKECKDKIAKDLQEFRMHPYLRTNSIIKVIDSAYKKIENELNDKERNHPDVIDDDYVMNTITSIFENKVGLPYTEDKYKQIYKTGEIRYQNKIPPGFKDKKYGDLVIWFQIIDKAKEIKKPIIFITDDKKEDWWFKYEGKKRPRPELINEIYAEAGIKFYMYQSDRFMYWAQKSLGDEIKEDAIREIKNIVKNNNDILNTLSINNIEMPDLSMFDEINKNKSPNWLKKLAIEASYNRLNENDLKINALNTIEIALKALANHYSPEANKIMKFAIDALNKNKPNLAINLAQIVIEHSDIRIAQIFDKQDDT